MDTIGIEHLAVAAAIIATVLAAVGALPQLRSVIRTGDVLGVSMSMVTLNTASEVGWFIHLSGRGMWAAVPTSFMIVIVYGTLGVALIRAGTAGTRPVAAGAFWAACLVGSRVAIGPEALAGLLAISKVIQMAPPVWTAWRTWRPSGISPTMWQIAVAESALWAYYGGVRGDAALVSLGVVGAFAGAAVLTRLAVTRNRPLVSFVSPGNARPGAFT